FPAHRCQYRSVCHRLHPSNHHHDMVFNNTKGSVLIAILGHWSFDFTFVILNLPFTAAIVTDYGSTLPVLVGLGTAALLVIVLTRGQLGYQHYRQEEPDLSTASR